MQCEDALNLISARLDGELSSDDRQRLDAHLGECADCRATAEAMQLQDAQLVRGFAPHRRAAVEVADRVSAQLRPAPRVRPGRWIPVFAAAAAGFLLAVLLLRPWQKVIEIQPVRGGPSVATSQERTAPHPQYASIGRLDIATGAVQVLAPGQSDWEPMATGASVPASARVRTGPGVRCEFAMSDGSEVRLNENSELLLSEPRRLDLKEGQVFSNVSRGAQPFQVAVAGTTVTALGTRFDIRRQQDAVILAVLQGTTKLDVGGSDQVVDQGQVVRLADGKLTRLQAADELDRATQWIYSLLIHKDPNNPELQDRVNQLFAQIGKGKMELLREDELKGLGDRCVLPLTRYLQSNQAPEMEFRRIEAARVIGDVAQPWCIPYLIELLGDHDGNVREYAIQALRRLTTGGPGPSPDEWRNMSPSQAHAAQVQWQLWWREKN
jgi:hypothetical protein